MIKDLGKQYTPGMFLTDEVRKEITKRYWEELVPEYFSHIYTSLQDKVEKATKVEQYNTLLPYLQEHVLEKALLYCERNEEKFDINKSKSKSPISYFMTLTKNIMIGERMGFINNIDYVNDPVSYFSRNRRPPHEKSINYFNTLCKRFNRDFLLDQLL